MEQDRQDESLKGEGQTGHETKEKALSLAKGGKKKALIDLRLLDLPGALATAGQIPVLLPW